MRNQSLTCLLIPSPKLGRDLEFEAVVIETDDEKVDFHLGAVGRSDLYRLTPPLTRIQIATFPEEIADKTAVPTVMSDDDAVTDDLVLEVDELHSQVTTCLRDR